MVLHSYFPSSFLFVLWSSQFLPVCITLSWFQSAYLINTQCTRTHTLRSLHASCSVCLHIVRSHISVWLSMHEWLSRWPLQSICDLVSPSKPLRPLSLTYFPFPCLHLTTDHASSRGQKDKFLPVNIFSLAALSRLTYKFIPPCLFSFVVSPDANT